MQKFQKRSKRNLVIGFGFSLFVLLLSSAFSFFSINQLLDSQRWVEHTTQVQSGLNNLISQMKDAETGQRGFLLTADEDFLEPYQGAREQVAGYLAQVQQLTQDNQSQQKDFPLLEKLIDEKLVVIDRTIADKKLGIPPSVSTLLRGKSTMDSIRVMVKTMNERESKLMVSRNARLNRFVVFTPILIGIAALLGMLITLLFYKRVQKDSGIATALEQELLDKQQSTDRQIGAISKVATRISKGDYGVRVDPEDLK